MAHPPQSPEADLWRIILLAASGARLLALSENSRLRLPALAVPRHHRVAENLTAALLSEWSQRAACSFRLDADPVLPELRYHVMESCKANLSATGSSQWVSVSSLQKNHFAEPSDFVAVMKALAACRDQATGHERGTVARLGWFSEVTAWVRDAAVREGLTLGDRFTQLNADPPFSLVRFETDGPALWFKAVGGPNLREYFITLALANYFPAFIPRLLANRDEWNGWLSMEARGAHPDQHSPATVWANVAERLADLQITSLGRTRHLIDAGCRDLRAASLAEMADPFFGVLAELMELQTTSCPPPLSSQQLRTLKEQLQSALADVQAGTVPNTLGHLDFNPGNVVVSGNQCIFLDWAEACVGHPFLTLDYLLAHQGREGCVDPHSRTQIVSAYAARWKDFIEPAEIARHLAFAPLLAVFAYAVSIDARRDPNQRHRPEIGKYLRSLARRMQREADRCLAACASRSVSCPS
jgi:hypothetical protein